MLIHAYSEKLKKKDNKVLILVDINNMQIPKKKKITRKKKERKKKEKQTIIANKDYLVGSLIITIFFSQGGCRP